MAGLEISKFQVRADDGSGSGCESRISGPARGNFGVSAVEGGMTAAQLLKLALEELMRGGFSPEQCVRLARGFSGFSAAEEKEVSESCQGSDVSSRSSRRSAARARSAVQRSEVHGALLCDGVLPCAAFFRTQALPDVRPRLEESQALSVLAAMPKAWYLPAVAAGSGPTLFPLRGGLGVDVGRVEGYPLLVYLKVLYALSPVFVHESWHPEAALAVTFPVRASPAWKVVHLELSVPAAMAGEAEGFCYLKLFPENLRVLRCAEFGRQPAVARLAWASGADKSLRMTWDGETVWHVSESSDGSGCTWGDLVSVVREGKSFEMGGLRVNRQFLTGHEVGAAPSSVGSGPVSSVADVGECGRADFSTFLDALREVREDVHEPLPHVSVYVKGGGDGSREQVRSGVVSAVQGDGGGWFVRFSVAYHAVVIPPRGCDVVVGGVTLMATLDKPRAVLASGGACLELRGPGAERGAFVKVLSRQGWLSLCSSLWLLPAASSSHRLAYLTDAPVVCLTWDWPVAEGGSRFERLLSKEVLHDETASWLATTREKWQVGKTGWYEVSTTLAVSIKMLEGEAFVGDFLMSAGAKAVFSVVDGGGVRGWMHGVRIQMRGDLGIELEVEGIADDYSFDGGGPSGDEEFCSGEEF